MKEMNYWNMFQASGKVEDYLNYKNKKEALENSCFKSESDGNEYARASQCDGTNYKVSSYGGIR